MSKYLDSNGKDIVVIERENHDDGGKFVVSWMRRAMAPKLAVAGVRAAIHSRIIRHRVTGHP